VAEGLKFKVVGRRGRYRGGLEGLKEFFDMAYKHRGDAPFIPRGVYRFKTHEEANEWTLKALTRTKAGQPQ
jgi:hypothetical protein